MLRLAAADPAVDLRSDQNRGFVFSFKAGDHVRIKSEDSSVRYRKPHIRTPGYIFGVVGRIEELVGYLENPGASSENVAGSCGLVRADVKSRSF